MYKVLIPQDIREEGKRYLTEKGYKVQVGSGADLETLKREIVDADAVIARTAEYPAEVILAGKKLKVIARYGVGYDNIDIKAAERQGIYVTIAKGGNTRSVAEHTIALMLACARNITQSYEELKKGNFAVRNVLPGTELRGKVFSVAGIGAIGLETARIAHDGFGMEVMAFDSYADRSRYPEWVEFADSLEDVLKAADVLSLHTPLTPETKHMINLDTMKRMKTTAIILNVARGPIWDEADLYTALKDGIILAAGADVFEEEPPNKELPLFTLPNYIASPHNAALTNDANIAVSMSCAEAVDDVLNGRVPKFPVNRPLQKMDLRNANK